MDRPRRGRSVTCPVCRGCGVIDGRDDPEFGRPSLANYAVAASDLARVSLRRIISNQRDRSLVRCRDLITHLAYQKGYTNAEIGKALGDRDPSTISQGRRRAWQKIARDPHFRIEMAAIEQRVKNCFDSRDYREGREAFMEKRKPVFVGK